MSAMTMPSPLPPSSTVEITASCLCRTNRFTTTTSLSSLPLNAICCHCSLCRRLTGGLYTCIVPWPEDMTATISRPDSGTDDTSSAHQSTSQQSGEKEEETHALAPIIAGQVSAALQAGRLSTRPFSSSHNYFFCTTCASLMFFDGTDEGKKHFGLFVGVLDTYKPSVTPGVAAAAAASNEAQLRPLLRVAHNKFLASTLDGGAMPWLRAPNPDGAGAADQPRMWTVNRGQSAEIKGDAAMFKLFRDNQPVTRSTLRDNDDEDEVGRGLLGIKCFCGGVDLVLRPPPRDIADAAAAEHNKGPDGYDHSRDVDVKTGRRKVSTCACTSCAKATGGFLTHWTSARLRDITFPDATTTTITTDSSTDKNEQQRVANQKSFPQNLSALAATAAVTAAPDHTAAPASGTGAASTFRLYRSSPRIQWYSCAVCSAAVLYANEAEPERVCVAVGLLRSLRHDGGDEGVRLERDLAWDFSREKVDFVEECRGGWREGIVRRMLDGAAAWDAGRE